MYNVFRILFVICNGFMFARGCTNRHRDVKLTPDCQVVVLDGSARCVHFYSRNGHLLSSCVSQGEGPEYLVSTPFFLCMDPAGNIIVSDCGKHSIKIISKHGHLMHTIGKEGNGIGELWYPYVLVYPNLVLYFLCLVMLTLVFNVSNLFVCLFLCYR